MKTFKEIEEAVYRGNLGFEELVKFYKVASHKEEVSMDKFIEAGDKVSAWKLIKQVLGIELHEGMALWLDYDLDEVFKPAETNYGTNFPEYDNKEIKSLSDGLMYMTYINVTGNNKLFYKITLRKEGDSYQLLFSTAYIKNINQLLQWTVSTLMDLKTPAVAERLNKIIFVMSEIIRKFNIDKINFSPATVEENPKLKNFYKVMVTNKTFLNVMKKLGFEKTGDQPNFYEFERFQKLKESIDKTVVIYPGRFSPPHLGHKSVYDFLKSKYTEVYVATSDRVDPPKSPFTFEEKKMMLEFSGIPAANIVQTKSPYQAQEILSQYDPETTSVIFAVSQKDMDEDPRFSFKPKKDGSPSYYQPIQAVLEPFSKYGYIMVAPTKTFNVLGKPMKSATELRSKFATVSNQDKKQIIIDLYGKFDQKILDLINSKIGSNDVN